MHNLQYLVQTTFQFLNFKTKKNINKQNAMSICFFEVHLRLLKDIFRRCFLVSFLVCICVFISGRLFYWVQTLNNWLELTILLDNKKNLIVSCFVRLIAINYILSRLNWIISSTLQENIFAHFIFVKHFFALYQFQFIARC